MNLFTTLEQKWIKKTYSNGGRVLSFICLSDSFKKSRNTIIKLIKLLDWAGGFFRKDIGYKVIDEWE